jgi:hypothetical protein
VTDAAHALAASSGSITRPLPPPPAARVWVGRWGGGGAGFGVRRRRREELREGREGRRDCGRWGWG